MTYLEVNEKQFKKFISKIESMGLKRDLKDRSTFPLDFRVFYKKHILNFEYLKPFLEWNITESKKRTKFS
ncbi:hypothetical protein HY500_01040 [Candidatus Woesearchaeota archaeon]|nr:hypothetical protein [Candidatus Woesearchaeota archaeon]